MNLAVIKRKQDSRRGNNRSSLVINLSCSKPQTPQTNSYNKPPVLIRYTRFTMIVVILAVCSADAVGPAGTVQRERYPLCPKRRYPYYVLYVHTYSSRKGVVRVVWL